MEFIETIVIINFLLTIILFISVGYIIIRSSIAISLMKALREQENILRQTLEKKEEAHVMTVAGPVPLSEFKGAKEDGSPKKKDTMFG